jgi:short-subunit dehydrogenase
VLHTLFCLVWYNGTLKPFLPVDFLPEISFPNSKRGLILNIGSFAGAVPSPMLATYSGSKAFLATFTSALAEEVAKDNITVEHVNTYFVVCHSVSSPGLTT